MVNGLEPWVEDACLVQNFPLHPRYVDVLAGLPQRELSGGCLGHGKSLLGVEEAVSVREAIRVWREQSRRREQFPQSLGMQPGLYGVRPYGMQPPGLDRLAEHDVAGADREVLQDEFANEIAQRVVGLVLPAELEDLVDATEDGLGPFGGGARVRVGGPEAFQEGFEAGLAAGEDVEAGGSGLAPFLVGERLEVGHAPERGDGAEQLAGSDCDVERKGVDQAAAGRSATSPLNFVLRYGDTPENSAVFAYFSIRRLAAVPKMSRE